MNWKKVFGITGGVIAAVAGCLEAYKTYGEIKNGVRLRDDQLDSLKTSVSESTVSAVQSTLKPFVDSFAENSKEYM